MPAAADADDVAEYIEEAGFAGFTVQAVGYERGARRPKIHIYIAKGRLRSATRFAGTDVDVVSCDNEKEMLSLMRPPPPSIDLNRTTIARLAVERLLWRMRNGMASPSVVITVTPTLVSHLAVPRD